MKRGSTDVLRVIDGRRISIAAMSLEIAQGALDCIVEVFQGAGAIRTDDSRILGHSMEAGEIATRC